MCLNQRVTSAVNIRPTTFNHELETTWPWPVPWTSNQQPFNHDQRQVAANTLDLVPGVGGRAKPFSDDDDDDDDDDDYDNDGDCDE